VRGTRNFCKIVFVSAVNNGEAHVRTMRASFVTFAVEPSGKPQVGIVSDTHMFMKPVCAGCNCVRVPVKLEVKFAKSKTKQRRRRLAWGRTGS
jgi:hypothetical protein